MAGPTFMLERYVEARHTQSHEMQDAHTRGECRPCAYFWHKSDGCRWGETCQFCHSCDREALKKQKKAKRQRMKAQAQALYRHDAAGTPEEANPCNVPIGDPVRIEVRPPPGLVRTSFLQPDFSRLAGGSDDSRSASTTPTSGEKDPYDCTDNYDLAAGLARYAFTVNSMDMIPTPKWAKICKSARNNGNKIGCYGLAQAAPTSAVWALVPEDPVLPAFIESTLTTSGGNTSVPGEGCSNYASGGSIMESAPSCVLQFEDMFP